MRTLWKNNGPRHHENTCWETYSSRSPGTPWCNKCWYRGKLSSNRRYLSKVKYSNSPDWKCRFALIHVAGVVETHDELKLPISLQGHAVFECGNISGDGSNVPLQCPLCPLCPTGQPPTFWKYCFTQHHHTDENLESPPVPFDLLKKVHISLAEGMAMGVGFREYDGIPTASPIAMRSRRENGIRGAKIFKFWNGCITY